jgi:predicted SprT family Zn-dependent metalloprotease
MGWQSYADVDDHDDLVAWSRSYAREVRREWVVDVRLDTVEWAVSTRAKRRAAAVKYPKLPAATVGEPIDWGDATTADGTTADGRPLPCTVSLTWGAFEAFDRAEWASVLRHELVHVEQYQRFGTSGHGPDFRRRAAALDTDVHCPTFTRPKYVLRCEDCDGLVARRYRDCKLVRERDSYRSSCCEAALTCERPTGD